MLKILIIDDDIKRANKLIKKIEALENSSFLEIKHFEYSNDAEKSMKLNQYDLLILDVLLPKKYKDIASAKTGLNLLKQLHNKGRGILLPKKIIGITVNEEDIEQYREEFDKYTSNIYDSNKTKWMENIVNYIQPLIESTISSKSSKIEKLLITIHGIRTFAPWQENLENIVEENVNNFKYEHIKFAFYSILLFIFPLIRDIVVKYLQKQFDSILEENREKEIYIVAHSFGTYIIVKLLEKTKINTNIHTLILSGSVLRNNYDLSIILTKNVKRIINECAKNDKILILCKIFVPFFSDAGRIGFLGRNNKLTITNRFYQGGHSVYFDDIKSNKNIMKRYWIPLLVNSDSIIRKDPDFFEPHIASDLIEAGLSIWVYIKNIFLLFIFPYLVYFYI